jgi:polysaccharide biosynthesis/export protein
MMKNSIFNRGKRFCLFIGACFGLMFVMVPPLKAVAEDYVIGDGDTLQISVWGEKELSTPVTVRPDGKITLPAVGDVTASGFNPTQLSEKLTEKLKKVVQKPIVTITVTGITNNKVYVFGGGVPSGVNNQPGRTSLIRFLCRLGSLKGADLEHAYIFRDGKKLDVNFYDIFIKGELIKDVMLKPEDVIYIPDNENNKIYLMGAVNTPKFIFYREGLKILDAIMEAGGFTKFAKENGVTVFRKESQGTKEIEVKVKDLMKEGDLSQNLYLMPGDMVFVKEGIF